MPWGKTRGSKGGLRPWEAQPPPPSRYHPQQPCGRLPYPHGGNGDPGEGKRRPQCRRRGDRRSRGRLEAGDWTAHQSFEDCFISLRCTLLCFFVFSPFSKESPYTCGSAVRTQTAPEAPRAGLCRDGAAARGTGLSTAWPREVIRASGLCTPALGQFLAS